MWKTLKKSCELGIKYVNQAIKFNRNYGKGHGPINHLNSIKIKNICIMKNVVVVGSQWGDEEKEKLLTGFQVRQILLFVFKGA